MKKPSKLRLALLIGLLAMRISYLSVVAQSAGGTVSGVVLDSMQGEPVAGVVVSVRGTTLGTKTDEQGRYTLSGVPSGDHILIFSRSGFERATVADVRVLVGQTSRANSRINPEFYEMDTYEVVAELFEDQSEILLVDRQESLQLMDSIGSDFISRVGASDAAGAVARVTGVTIAEGKYAVIRGLADRYTFTTLNGLELPSADNERRAVQLDLFPAQAIESVEVTKTFTPDQPGNTTGGRVNIVTKSFPEKFTFAVKVGVAYNTQSSLRDDFASSPVRGGTDFWGKDDGTRALPEGFKDIPFGGVRFVDDPTRTALNRSLNKPFAGENRRSPLDSKFSIFVGDTTELFGRPLGLIGSFSYDRKFRYYDDGKQARYDTSDLAKDLNDTRGVEAVLWGALASLAYELHEDHKLSFTFAYNQASDNEARTLTGPDYIDGEQVRPDPIGDPSNVVVGELESYVLDWTERNVTSFQFKGDHHLREVLDMQLDWGAAFSTTSQETPDLRMFAAYKQPSIVIPPFTPPWDVEYNYELGVNPLGLLQNPVMYWRDLTGNNVNFTFDDRIPFQQWSGLDSEVKFGLYYSKSEQTYNERAYTFDSDLDPTFPTYRQDGQPNDFLDDPRIVPDANGDYEAYVVDYQTRTAYEASLDVPALYLMTDLALAEPLKLVAGVRVEGTDQQVVTTTTDGSKPPETTEGLIDVMDWLPAAGLIYNVIPSMNIRLNYGKTVARPTFREISDAEYVDFGGGNTFSGNPDLNRSRADNFDLRWEWFPTPGDVLAASAFYKNINEPIERVERNLQGTITYENAEVADVFGLEFEARKNLGFIHPSIKNFSLGGNYAYIKSEVPRPGAEFVSRPSASDVRPLYDQPTYVFNADLTYDNPDWGTVATLSFNITGQRLVQSSLQTPDVYREPVPVLNFTVSQRLWKNLKLGFSAKNLLNPSIREVYDVEGNSVANGQTYSEFSVGVTFGVSLSYEF